MLTPFACATATAARCTVTRALAAPHDASVRHRLHIAPVRARLPPLRQPRRHVRKRGSVSLAAQAEFDIDKGSVLRQQYPRKVTDDEGLMAELMIPEGIHNHFQDWTVFMLNRPTQPPKQAAAPRKWPVQAYKYEGESPAGQWVLASAGGADATHFAQVNGAATPVGGKRAEAHVVVDLGQVPSRQPCRPTTPTSRAPCLLPARRPAALV